MRSESGIYPRPDLPQRCIPPVPGRAAAGRACRPPAPRPALPPSRASRRTSPRALRRSCWRSSRRASIARCWMDRWERTGRRGAQCRFTSASVAPGSTAIRRSPARGAPMRRKWVSRSTAIPSPRFPPGIPVAAARGYQRDLSLRRPTDQSGDICCVFRGSNRPGRALQDSGRCGRCLPGGTIGPKASAEKRGSGECAHDRMHDLTASRIGLTKGPAPVHACRFPFRGGSARRCRRSTACCGR